MTAKETDSARLREKGSSLTNEPSPDMMLGLWISWMEAQSGLTPDWFSSNKPWWEVTPDKVLGKMIAGGVKALNETLAKDPLLRSADQMWNANPLREVIPVDWAEIARALRFVWMRSLARPAQAATTAAQLSQGVWNAAIDAWNQAGQQWWSSPSG